MSYRYRHVAVIALLAMGAGAGTQLASGQEEKQSNSVKGVITKSDQVKKCVTIKSADGEREYSLADEVLIVNSTGQKTHVSLKQGAQVKLLTPAQRQAIQVLLFALRDGNEVSLWVVAKGKVVTAVSFDNTSEWQNLRRPK
jgi:hypothetical protein